MDRAAFYLILAGLWFTFAGYIAVVAELKSGRTFAFVIGVIFGLYNIIRFLLARRRNRHDAPAATLPRDVRNSNFDFEGQDREFGNRFNQGPR